MHQVTDSHSNDALASLLSEVDIEQFKKDGYICIRQVFAADLAYKCRNILWNKLMDDGINPDDPMTWVRRKSIGHMFPISDGSPWSDVFPTRLTKAIDSICGENRWCKPAGLGWWTISFPGWDSDRGWDVEGQWHIDGSHIHYPFNKEVGLTAIMLFSEVRENLHGPTTVLKGSHKYMSKLISEAGFRGLSGYQIKKKLNVCDEEWETAQFTGQPGDVYLMHPFLVHARSRNVGDYGDRSSIRYLCHPAIALKEDMNFCGKILSPLEQSIFDSVPPTDGYSPLYFITPANVNEFAGNRRKREAEMCDRVGEKRKPNVDSTACRNENSGHDDDIDVVAEYEAYYECHSML